MHKYAVSGNYIVSFSAISDSGCSTIASSNLHIYPVPLPQFLKKDNCLGDSSRFTNVSSIQSGSLNFQWRLTPGMVSAEKNTTYKYQQAGPYAVTLTASSNFGCKDSVTQSIIVHEKPKSDFEFTSACDGTPTELKNNSTIR
jgi:uncharacterized membrane protein